MNGYSIQDTINLYGIDGWGANYFGVDDQGRLVVTPTKQADRQIALIDIVTELKKRRLSAPVLLRFPQILDTQVQAQVNAFQNAIREFNYQKNYLPVFPVKVNQQESVVSRLLAAGYPHKLGLEVGSKPELLAALSLSVPEGAITTCNGFKDQEYFDIVSLGVRAGRTIITVIEKPFELLPFLKLAKEGKPLPWLGFRIRLNAKGSGLWEKSSGNYSKFGLSTNQLLEAIEKLEKENLLSHVKLFHYHIGSQITEIRRIKEAIKEAARVYCKARKMGVPIEYLNVGGGLGVDYDGSKTSSDASVNYTVDEYANDVVYNIVDVCESERVPHPNIVTESGRYLTAYHSVLVMDARDQVHEKMSKKPKFGNKEPKVIEDLLYIYDNISVKNYREFYHDALERRDEMNSLFRLGMLELEDRGKGEWLYWAIASAAVRYSKTAKVMADEFIELEQRMFEKVICNFSVFQSIPDHWALDQLFPIVPIQRLNEKPSRRATIADITCDSDGEVDKFVDLKDIKAALEIHELRPNEPYHIALLMIGAYQDTMGDMHNLFGKVHECEVVVEGPNKMLIQSADAGDTVAEVLDMFGYEYDKIVKNLRSSLQQAVGAGRLTEAEASAAVEQYKTYLKGYTYLQ